MFGLGFGLKILLISLNLKSFMYHRHFSASALRKKIEFDHTKTDNFKI